MIVYKSKEEVLLLPWLKNPKPIKNISGAYVVIDKINKDILYVGQASDLGQRLCPSVHPLYNKELHDVFILFESDRNERRRMEWSFIQLLKPTMNIRSGLAPKDGKVEFFTKQYDRLFNH